MKLWNTVNWKCWQFFLLRRLLSTVQDDYYVTSDQMYVPLRWIAPELVDEVHGNLLVAEQTQQSNMW